MSAESPSPAPDSSATSQPFPSATPFFAACCVFLILMELIGVTAMQHLSTGPDFRNFYGAGVMVRTEPHNLYNLARQKQVQDALISPEGIALPYVHPAYEALLFAPFALLKYRAAYHAFIAFNVLLLAGVFLASRPIFSVPIPWVQSEPGLNFFFFFPLLIAMWHAQDSILFLLLCCCAWRFLDRGDDALAGCVLALCLFRFQVALPLAVLVALRKGWRFSAAFAAAGAALVLLCLVITGISGAKDMIHLLTAVSLMGQHDAAAQFNMAMIPTSMPNLFGLLYGCGTRFLSAHLAFAITMLLSLALYLYSAFRVHREQNDAVAFAIALLCSILVSQHLYLHDATLLLLPIALLARNASPWLLAACYYTPIVLFLCRGGNWFLLALPILALLFNAHSQRAGVRLATLPQPIFGHKETA